MNRTSTATVSSLALESSNTDVLYVLDSSHGLPSNQIHRIARDHQSRLWLPGPTGVSCFDGSFVRAFDRRSGLQCNGLRCIAISDDGTLWVGTDLGMQALDEFGRPFADSSPFLRPNGLCEDIVCIGRELWVGAAQGLLHFEVETPASPPRLTFSASIGFVESIVAMNARQVYAASNRMGLVKSDGASWSVVESDWLKNRSVGKLVMGRRGEVFVGTDAGLFLLDPATDAVTPHLSRSDEDTTVTAIADGADELWVAFGNRLVAYPRDVGDSAIRRVQVFELESRINDLLIDELDNLWIATDSSGLALISCLRRAIERIDIGANGAVFSIKPRPTPAYVIGGERLLQIVSLPRNAPPTSVPAPGSMPPTTVWDSYHDGQGRWIAAQTGLYYAPDDGLYQQMFADHPVLGAPARVVMPHRGAVWIGTLRGLVRLSNGVPIEVRGHDDASLGYIYTLVTDRTARIWVGTLGRGLWMGDESVSQIARGLLSETGNTYAIAPGPNGQTLVLQDEKVLLLDEAFNTRLIEEHYPVSGWTAMWLDDHTIAIGSSNGLRFVDVLTGVTNLSVHSLLSLRQWEFTNNRTLVRDEQGRLLCGVNAGLVRIDPKLLFPLLIEPKPKLLDVAWHGVAPELVDGVYRLRPGRWSLQVRAFAAWFVDHTKVRFQFKLVGFDDQWSASQTSPSITYTSLPVGRYEICCRSQSPLTGEGESVTLCRLEVLSPWWATGWAGIFSGITATYERVIHSRSRNAALIERNAALEREVQDRTAKLQVTHDSLKRAHDQLEQLSVTDALTRVSNRRGLDRLFAIELKRAQRSDTPIGLILFDIDHFKMVNDRLGHAAGDEYLRIVAEVLLSGVRDGMDAVARYGGEEFVVVMHDAPIEAARALAQRLCAALEKRKLANPGSPLGHLTISAGVAILQPHAQSSFDELLRSADRSLYEAKQGGRNRVVVSSNTNAQNT
jgi:diguanylate cyclase (GGDEF)-like protein